MTFPDNQRLCAAIASRHSVRRYLDKPLDKSVTDCIAGEIKRINHRRGFSFRLVTDEPRAFKNIFAYGKFENVKNYIIVSAPEGDEFTRLCGYEGERLVLALQAMGLNTCWVGLSYSKRTEHFDVPRRHKIRCVISVGYGLTQGSARKSKSMEALSNANAQSPQWFTEAMQAVMLAPTAINQQKFEFTLNKDLTVDARPKFSLVGYTQIDLGIALFHFNLAAAGHQVSPITLTTQRIQP